MHETTCFSSTYRGAIKVVATLDSSKCTRDATKNCFKITNLIRKDKLQPRSVKKVRLSRMELTFDNVSRSNVFQPILHQEDYHAVQVRHI